MAAESILAEKVAKGSMSLEEAERELKHEFWRQGVEQFSFSFERLEALQEPLARLEAARAVCLRSLSKGEEEKRGAEEAFKAVVAEVKPELSKASKAELSYLRPTTTVLEEKLARFRKAVEQEKGEAVEAAAQEERVATEPVEEEAPAPVAKPASKALSTEAWVAELKRVAEEEESKPRPRGAWFEHPLYCSCPRCVQEYLRSCWNSWRNCQPRRGESEAQRKSKQKCLQWGVGSETVQRRASRALGCRTTELLGRFHDIAVSSSSELEVWAAFREALFKKRGGLNGSSLWKLWKSVAFEHWGGTEPLSLRQLKAAVYELVKGWVEGVWCEKATVLLLQEGIQNSTLLQKFPSWAGCTVALAPSSMESKDVDAVITSPTGEVVERVSIKHGERTLTPSTLVSWAQKHTEPTVYAGYWPKHAPMSATSLKIFKRSEVEAASGRY